MGFHVNESQFDAWLTEQRKTYDIYAPMRYAGGSTFSDVECIRYYVLRRDFYAGRMSGKTPDTYHY